MVGVGRVGGEEGGRSVERRFLGLWKNHLEERLLDQVQAQVPFTAPVWGNSRSTPQGMISDAQPLVKPSFWETK